MSYPPIILFDFDGVIITQKSLEYTALYYLRKKFYNWQNTSDIRLIDFARLFEESDSKNRLLAYTRINKVFKPFIPSIWRRNLFFIKFRRMYPKYEKYESLKPNLEKILIKLKQNNFLLGIVSNTGKRRLDSFRQKLNLDENISIYVSRDDTPYRKPSPYPIITALKKIKKNFNYSINKDNVYYVGDLPADIECAKNAKIKSIALLSGHGTKEDLENSNPTILLQDIKNILEIEEFKKFLLD
ncbi:MAG: HAD family hydrolase [Candidatus Lokiarchaeota archaeon]|nr:HAD family hydrolase [Candidatus Lokiarchaeota archaeon]